MQMGEVKTVQLKITNCYYTFSYKEAYKMCNEIMRHGMTKTPEAEKIAKINNEHLKGITYEQIEREVNKNER